MEALRKQNPVSAANLMANGKLMVEWARDGRLKELQCAIDNMDEDRVVLFYSVRMFRVACAGRRLDVLKFMLANGFDVTQVCMRDILHSVVESIGSDDDADAAQALIRFLIDAGVDVNWQRKPDLYTALHLACAKNLYAIAYLLILYNADVNAIAANDEMPLVSAQRMGLLGRTPSQLDLDRNEQLLSLLTSHRARPTWRKTPTVLKSNNQQQPSTNGHANTNTASTRPGIVLSFSSAVTFSLEASPTRPVSVPEQSMEEHEESHAFAHGIQLDTEGPFLFNQS